MTISRQNNVERCDPFPPYTYLYDIQLLCCRFLPEVTSLLQSCEEMYGLLMFFVRLMEVIDKRGRSMLSSGVGIVKHGVAGDAHRR